MPRQSTKRQLCFYASLPVFLWILGLANPLSAEPDRARALGIPFAGKTGPLNGITDVLGVEVGHKTLISGEGPLVRGVGPIRTGVTVIHPRGKASTEGVYGGWFTLNASGEMTGTTWLEERGLIDGPIGITNTHSVGIVRDAFVGWMVDQKWPALWHAPNFGASRTSARPKRWRKFSVGTTNPTLAPTKLWRDPSAGARTERSSTRNVGLRVGVHAAAPSVCSL